MRTYHLQQTWRAKRPKTVVSHYLENPPKPPENEFAKDCSQSNAILKRCVLCDYKEKEISVLVTTWYRVQFCVNNLYEKSILESQAEEILTAHAICNFHPCYNFALVWNEKCTRFQPIKSAQCLHIHRFYCCRRFRLSQFLIICIVSFMRDYFTIWF